MSGIIPADQTAFYAPPYTSLALSMFAAVQIEGRTFTFPVNSVKCKFPLVASGGSSDLPECSVELATGFEAFSGTPVNSELLRNLVFQIPIEVYLMVSGTSGNPTGILGLHRNGRYVLFRGFVTDILYSRIPGKVGVMLKAIHWLYALNFSSALSETSHPKNPADLTFNAFLRTGAGSRGGLTNLDDFQATIGPLNVMQDMWGYAIWPWFLSLASTDRINVQAFWPGINDSANRLSYWALNQFWFGPGYRPLSVRTDYVASQYIILSISNALAGLMAGTFHNSLHDLANKTLWEELVRLADHFFFMVIPLPLTAVVAPFVPALGTIYDPYSMGVTILRRDIFTVRVASNLDRPLRAVGLFGSVSTFAGSDLSSDPVSAGMESLIGGAFVAPNIPDGMVMFNPAPFYAATVVEPSVFGPLLLGARGNAFAAPGRGSNNRRLKSQMMQGRKAFLDNLSQYLYNTYVTYKRRVLLSGPLRFDIAPGSTIAIEGVTSWFHPSDDVKGSTVYGLVRSVEHQIHVGGDEHSQAECKTVLELQYIRNGVEQLHPAFVSTTHPLYKNTFAGMPMLNGPF